MLVLSRRCNEQIVLPTLDVVITVLGVSSGKVRIGIEAPRDVPILRREIAVALKDLHHDREACLVGCGGSAE